MPTKFNRMAGLIVSLLFVSINAFGAMDYKHLGGTSAGLIEAAYQAGDLTYDEKAILQITAIRSPEALPADYRAEQLVASVEHGRSATLILKDLLVDNWSLLSPAGQAEVSQLMSRPSADSSSVSPSGFFTLHYSLTGSDAVSSFDLDSTGIPDYVEKIAAYCDSALLKHRELGYLDPPSDGGVGGDSTYDVYFENMEYYGYASPEDPGPEPWTDFTSYLVLHNSFAGFPPNNDPEGNAAGAAKATAAHEFHHAVQFAYDVQEDLWYMELDAVWMEDIVYDAVDDNYNYLPEFFGEPHVTLMEESLHMYASFVWMTYLAQTYDTSLALAVWNGARQQDIFDALADTLSGRYGVSVDNAFAEFAVWNYITNTRDDGLHYEEGFFYPAADLNAVHSSYPVSDRDFLNAIQGYAAGYVQFQPQIDASRLLVDLNGADAVPWRAFAVKSTAINQHVIEEIPLDPVTREGNFSVDDFEAYYSVGVVVVNLNEYGGPAEMRYSATLQLSQALSSDVETEPRQVYSGSSRPFTVWVHNIAGINDLVDVYYQDGSGWVPPDSNAAFIAPGDSVAFTIDVLAPQGTPVNDSTVLDVLARSRNEPGVETQQLVTISTVLQRGDVNFDGIKDLADVLYLANAVFLGGPAIQPEQTAGDADCDTMVDLADVLYLSSSLFLSGPDIPCNPF